jgi:NTE family protein
VDQTHDLPEADRVGLLATRPILRGLARSVLEDIAASLESLDVRGGAPVVRQGQAEVPFVLVVEGGLRASFADEAGRRHVVSEYFRGSTVGEALVLSGRPSPLDLHAIRDSRLLYLSPERFAAIALRHPELTLAFARSVSGRMVDLASSREFLSFFSRKVDRIPRSIALLSVGSARARRARDAVYRALSRARVTVRPHATHARGAELVVFECDPSDPMGLDFALRQADRILVLVDELHPAEAQADWWREARLWDRPAQLELALVHPASAELPAPGTTYHRLPGIERVSHVRDGCRGDFERVARRLLERPVGLVLGGGGAYGIAHVGVVKALEEAHVPVDVVGGTSMGAIFAGGVARGWSADRMMDEVRRLFSARFALYDPTIPFTALLAGKKLDRVLEGLFGEIDIADTWIPFFSVATNISLARPQVRESGKLREAIRASCSIPGLFPPFQSLEQLLVDGGLVDNLPIDVMGERCRGPVIAVDVFPYERPREKPSEGPLGRIRRYLGRLRSPADVRPPLFDILTRSTFVGSQRATERSLTHHPPALYLVPDLGRFGILEWGAYEALFQAGYECARRSLDAGALPRSLWEGRVEDRPRKKRNGDDARASPPPLDQPLR